VLNKPSRELAIMNAIKRETTGLAPQAERSRTIVAQSIVACVHFRLGANGVRKNNGEINTGMTLPDVLRHVGTLNVGEIQEARELMQANGIPLCMLVESR
jgi:hypothetical protein